MLRTTPGQIPSQSNAQHTTAPSLGLNASVRLSPQCRAPISPAEYLGMRLDQFEHPEMTEVQLRVAGPPVMRMGPIPPSGVVGRMVLTPVFNVTPARVPALVRLTVDGALCQGDVSNIQELQLMNVPRGHNPPISGFKMVTQLLSTARSLHMLKLTNYLTNPPDLSLSPVRIDVPSLKKLYVMEEPRNICHFLASLANIPSLLSAVAVVHNEQVLRDFDVLSPSLPQGFLQQPTFKDVHCVSINFSRYGVSFALAGRQGNATFSAITLNGLSPGSTLGGTHSALLRSCGNHLKKLRPTTLEIGGVDPSTPPKAWEELFDCAPGIRELIITSWARPATHETLHWSAGLMSCYDKRQTHESPAICPRLNRLTVRRIVPHPEVLSRLRAMALWRKENGAKLARLDLVSSSSQGNVPGVNATTSHDPFETVKQSTKEGYEWCRELENYGVVDKANVTTIAYDYAKAAESWRIHQLELEAQAASLGSSFGNDS